VTEIILHIGAYTMTIEGGTAHNDLIGRSASDCHTIFAITGLQGELDSKQPKETGKGLSTEDFTTVLKDKLDEIEARAQVNLIESISSNGVPIEIVGKNVNVYVPTSLSQLSSDSTHQTVTADQKLEWSGKADLVNGKVPSSELPSYVDDVIDSYIVGSEAFASDWLSDSPGGDPLTPEAGKIYMILSSGEYVNRTYRWSGTIYAEISPSLVLGETADTAYRGDRGKIAYDHSLNTSNPHQITKTQVGLGNVDNTSDANKPVSTPQATSIALKVSIAQGVPNAGKTLMVGDDGNIVNVMKFYSDTITGDGTTKVFTVDTGILNSGRPIFTDDNGFEFDTLVQRSGTTSWIVSFYEAPYSGETITVKVIA